MKIQKLLPMLAVIGLFCGSLQAAQPLSLGSLFTDHAVLQRDIPAPVWGRAEPDAKVIVQFAGQEKTAIAGKDGRWTVKLDPMAASATGQRLSVKTESGSEKLTREDLLVGEVWVCSGQSNMVFPVKECENGAAATAAAGDGLLRLFVAKREATDQPRDAIEGSWELDSPQSVEASSGVAYFFGKSLRKTLGVPVGLVESAVGGTPAEAWTPMADIESNPALQGILQAQAKAIATYPKLLESYKRREAKSLERWQEAVAEAKAKGAKPPRKPRPPEDPTANKRRPAGLYNGSIAPLIPYAMRGVIWYQGEGNAHRAKEYETLFPAMIGAWRKAWNQGDFPFLFVQIAPCNGQTPEIREAQRVTTETTPNTAMAVTVDVGDPNDIHPKKKQPVGERLALAARALAYGEPIEFSGPTYDGMSVAGNRLTLAFKHLGGGLVAKGGGELKGFEVAGGDENFVAAKATIEGDMIVVSSESVPTPVAARYAWASSPEGNLFNRADLPASPFRTTSAFELEPGFEWLFNGTDLTGWRLKNGPALDGQTVSSNGRYTARDGRIVVNPGKGTDQLWTTREFPRDFQLKLQFRAGVNADSGVFLRKPQLQCRDYLVAGPYKELKNYKPQDWNDLEVTVRGASATCACNGEPLKFASELPATGPIGLEADRGQMEYRRIRVKQEP